MLPELAVLVILLVAIGPSEISLTFEDDTVLAGEVPVATCVVGFTLITPAATPPARGNNTAPTEAAVGAVDAVVFGVFLAFS